jgi:PIN domain
VAKTDNPAETSASALVTHHVFLDTQVYRTHAHNPDSPMLLALRDHIAADRLVLHITDITLAEIERQLGELAGEAAAAMKKARRQFGGWKKRLPKTVTGDPPNFEQAVVAKAAFKQFRKRAQEDWRVVDHAATAVAAVDIFRDYFRRKPPFEHQGSKEFPDAFVVRSLEEWCKQNDERMYVIGADKAMAAAVEKSAVLLLSMAA